LCENTHIFKTIDVYQLEGIFFFHTTRIRFVYEWSKSRKIRKRVFKCKWSASQKDECLEIFQSLSILFFVFIWYNIKLIVSNVRVMNNVFRSFHSQLLFVRLFQRFGLWQLIQSNIFSISSYNHLLWIRHYCAPRYPTRKWIKFHQYGISNYIVVILFLQY
jgi:hypothetical protein